MLFPRALGLPQNVVRPPRPIPGPPVTGGGPGGHCYWVTQSLRVTRSILLPGRRGPAGKSKGLVGIKVARSQQGDSRHSEGSDWDERAAGVRSIKRGHRFWKELTCLQFVVTEWASCKVYELIEHTQAQNCWNGHHHPRVPFGMFNRDSNH